MGTIADYPGPARPLDGSELVAGYQDGRQIAIPLALIGKPMLVRPGGYRYGGFAVDAIRAEEILMEHHVIQGHRLASDLAGCAASAGIAPAAPWMMTIALNDVPIGTVTINPIGDPTMSMLDSVARDIERGDVVTVFAPSIVDASIGRVRFTLSGEAA